MYKYSKFRAIKNRKHFWLLLFFVILTFLVFFPVIFGDPFWDDWVFIFTRAGNQLKTNNPFIFFPFGKASKSWPIFYLTIWAMFKTFKEHFLYYHLVSITLHGLNGFLCWKILKKINIKHALPLALIFLFHPLQLFTVAWIIQLKTILATFFFFICLYFLINFSSSKKKRNILLALIFFALSIFSKATTGAFAACVVFFPYFFDKNTNIKKFVIIFSCLASIAVIRTAWTFNLKEVYQGIRFNIAEGEKKKLYYSQFYFPDEIKNTKPGYLAYPQLIFSDKTILSAKVFLHYFLFVLFPINAEQLFHEKVVVYYTSIEFILVLFGTWGFIYVAEILLKRRKGIEFLGLIFYIASLLPLCGAIYIPIYATSNFVPYWLSIPFIGLLPLISMIVDSKKILFVIAALCITLTHWKSYSFINTDEIFVESIKQYPDNNTLKIALIEHYTFVHQCEKARRAYADLLKTEDKLIFHLEQKVLRCKLIQDN